MEKLKVLSLPARHPYTSKFHESGDIVFVNPDTDYFGTGKNNLLHHIKKHHPLDSYDVVHVHFSFDHVPLVALHEFLEYSKSNKKPIVWTCHSRESQRILNLGNGKYQKLLFNYADKIISPTQGCRSWIIKNIGWHKRKIAVIPLGYMTSPDDILRLKQDLRKDKDLFTYLIGEFRENKEFINSIVQFLKYATREQKRLQLIFKPVDFYLKHNTKQSQLRVAFDKIVKHSRITVISAEEISNDVITRAFIKSHGIILPYKWGTHSGQLELARDCGCYPIISNVGFYKEQWDKALIWKSENPLTQKADKEYIKALNRASTLASLKPDTNFRKKEHLEIVRDHEKIYRNLILGHLASF